jgi:hypothetical protein
VINLHPFFVHAPLVLIPLAAVFVWFRRANGLTLFVTVAAAIAALVAMASGLVALDTIVVEPGFAEVLRQHRINGIVLAAVSSVAAMLAVAEWRGWITARAWWVRALVLTWMSVGTFYAGHSGATLVYVHGVAVKR